MIVSGAQRPAVEMSHGCLDTHHRHGGVCRVRAAWRGTGGGCRDRFCNSRAYGILTMRDTSAEISLVNGKCNSMKNNGNSQARYRIGVDVGGTFIGALDAVEAARVDPEPTGDLVHGSTVAANAVAAVGLTPSTRAMCFISAYSAARARRARVARTRQGPHPRTRRRSGNRRGSRDTHRCASCRSC